MQCSVLFGSAFLIELINIIVSVDKKTNNTTKQSSNANNENETDLEKMRSSIQLLVQHTGPLGTCMDYIQEDISLMTSELHRWEEECRK